ncbi:MAG TPA: FAD-dependent oxidoreductase [Myxococcota bacterium]|nr:FAD-dependent oxidoreductase [Myxococcota bacterium]
MAGIAVVGGGIAGLACAWRLVRAGHEVEVLERAPEPGGRMQSVRRGDFQLDLGAPGFARSDAAIHVVADALGLADAIRPYAHGRDAWMRDAVLRPLGRDTVAAVVTAPDALRVARARRTPLAERVDPARPAILERARLAAEIAALASAAALSWLPAPPTADAETLRVLAGLRAHWSGAELASFEGGTGALAAALASRLRVRTGCAVRRVETFTGGARIAIQEESGASTLDADAVVVAVPGRRVTSLCPKLTPEERGFFEAVRYAPALVVFLAFARVPSASLRSVFIGPESGLELSALVLEHLRPGAAPHGAGLVRAVLAPEASVRMHRASDASIADLAAENLAYGRFGAPAPADYAVARHPDAWPLFEADDVRRLARFLQRFERSPRIAFAGDYLMAPSADGALASGLRAAAELEASL